MQFINPETVTDIEQAREMLMDLQKRLFKAENSLDDVARSVEIAQCTRQYNVTEVFIAEAMELLKDRLVFPKTESNGPEITIVEASDDAWKQGVDILNDDPHIEKMKHGEITGIVKTDETENEIK